MLQHSLQYGTMAKTTCSCMQWPLQPRKAKKELTTFGELGPSADGFLQSIADVACSNGAVRCVGG